jgi:hypothetical protein
MANTAKCAEATQGMRAKQKIQSGVSRIALEGRWSPTTGGPHVLIDLPHVPCCVDVAFPQDRTSAEWDGNSVLLLAESDPVGPVDVGGEGVVAPRAELACPEFINDLDAAPLGDLPQQ